MRLPGEKKTEKLLPRSSFSASGMPKLLTGMFQHAWIGFPT